MSHPEPSRPNTLIETDEEVRDVLQQQAANAASVKARSAGAVPWRPTVRPPVATLIVYEDGKTTGEVIPIRAAKFVIGRTEGDLLIPHDALISTRHVEITRQQIGGIFRWVLTDLQSTNGLFIRVSKTQLTDRTEILVGNGRYRFDAPDVEAGGTVDHLPGDEKSTGSTHNWSDGQPTSRPPAMTEVLGDSIGNRVVLTRLEYWIGTDPWCAICRPNDPFCEPRHCRISRGTKGGWYAEHPRTLNGLWYRAPQVILDRTAQF